MINFKEQIDEDIVEIKEQYIDIDPKLSDNAYAFNFWVLQKLYSVEEEIIPNFILEDSDRGIDCYFFNEDKKELFLIQNKFYIDTTLRYRAIVDEFFSRSLEHLKQGIYSRNVELQEIFTKYKNDDDFKVFLHYYVTNDSDVYESYKVSFERYEYNSLQCIVCASFFSLEDIADKYFTDRNKPKKTFSVELRTISKQTRVDINPEHIRGDSRLIRSQFMPVNVVDFYLLLKKAKDEKYPLFEENLRNYIGENSAINAGIISTLRNPVERDNFLFYNNGITIIADEINVETIDEDNQRRNTKFSKLKNPQIVNGCQTVNSIYHVLKTYPTISKMKEDFEQVFVMVKLLQLSSTDDKEIFDNIVKYNNSQNAIKSKDFVAAQEEFTYLHNDFRDYGFFLITKQNHANDFRSMPPAEKNKLLSRAQSICETLEIELKVSDLKIDLTKLLQTILAYYDGGYLAYVRKHEILKKGSPTYNKVVSKIKTLTRQQILSIYLYFLKAEKSRKKSEDKINPVPYYLLTFLSRIQEGIMVLYGDSLKFVANYSLAEKATNTYMILAKGRESQYNKMIKKKMYEDLITSAVAVAKGV